MSLSSQKAIYYLVDQFNYYLLIRCIKTSAVLKRQQLKDSESDKTESSVSKCQWLDMHDNEEWQSLDEYESEDKGKRYIFLPFIALLLPL